MEVALSSMGSDENNCLKWNGQEEEGVKTEGAKVKRRITHECVKCGETYRKLLTLNLHMREDHPDTENQIVDPDQDIEEQDQKEGIQKEIEMEEVGQEMEDVIEEYKNEVEETLEKVFKSEAMGSLKRKRIMEMEEQQGGKSAKRKAHISLKGKPVALEQPEIVLDNLSFEILEDHSKILSSLPKSTKITFIPSREASMLGEKRSVHVPLVPAASPAAKKLLVIESKKKVVKNIVESKSLVASEEKCCICKQKVSKLDMIKHMNTHQINCQHCNFICTSNKSLEVHRKSQHVFKCKCKLVLATEELLEAHTKLEHMFHCQKCIKTFNQKPILENHMKTMHFFKCTTCGKGLETKTALEEHEKAEHSSCFVCEDEFSWAEAGHECYYTKNNIKPVIGSSW